MRITEEQRKGNRAGNKFTQLIQKKMDNTGKKRIHTNTSTWSITSTTKKRTRKRKRTKVGKER